MAGNMNRIRGIRRSQTSDGGNGVVFYAKSRQIESAMNGAVTFGKGVIRDVGYLEIAEPVHRGRGSPQNDVNRLLLLDHADESLEVGSPVINSRIVYEFPAERDLVI